MKDYGELIVTGDPASLQQLAPLLEQTLPAGSAWHRHRERDAGVGVESEMICFVHSEEPGLRAAHLWLHTASARVRVSNMVSTGGSSLDFDEYNALLADFARVLEPAVRQLGLSLALDVAERSIRDLMSDEAAALLEAFARAANKSTGAAHPEDERRWMDFVLAAHRRGDEIDGSDLQRWLHDEGFPHDVSFDLATQYESARQVLKYYDASAAE